MKEHITILGATGSIGHNTLDVVAQHPGRYKIWGLSAQTQMVRLAELVKATGAKVVSIGSGREQEFRRAMKGSEADVHILEGEEGLSILSEMPETDVLVTGIVGAAGLLPTLKAVRAGKKILIANKEPLVMMGSEIMHEAGLYGATIIPIDSEHNAIFQCLPDSFRNTFINSTGRLPTNRLGLHGVRKLILTASGGPFLDSPKETLEHATPEAAAAHPNWRMGTKISIDSATMMNKGLELIEACALFGADPCQIEVVIHPQSIVHSFVEYEDGSILAQMANPDMRIPIINGLGFPDRISSGTERLSIGTLGRLDFSLPDNERFPCLNLARTAATLGGAAPTILNAANEVAVKAFCDRKVGFSDIAVIIEKTLDQISIEKGQDLETILASDLEARTMARFIVESNYTDASHIT